MSIECICQRNVDTIGPSDSAYQAAERMLSEPWEHWWSWTRTKRRSELGQPVG